jgi:polyhydroxyalkanoate synthesis repressor PhaR
MTVLIKRYANRKLYNTQSSRYITLKGIAELIDADEDVRVIDNETGEDITSVALSQILVDSERGGARVSPAALGAPAARRRRALRRAASRRRRCTGGSGASSSEGVRRLVRRRARRKAAGSRVDRAGAAGHQAHAPERDRARLPSCSTFRAAPTSTRSARNLDRVATAIRRWSAAARGARPLPRRRRSRQARRLARR